ncbi:MAG: NAD(P)H-hydrate dehydratase [Deltaproteobacteria bacterium]|nr:NAD(P)H-hydrate dehydratase [Deltaproteobacteria bacterium]
MKAVYSAEMRILDDTAIRRYGIPGMVLMENAGRAVAEAVVERLDGRGRVLILCGPGNNGGDGYVAARHLANGGFEVMVLATRLPSDLNADASANARIYREMGLPLRVLAEGEEPGAVLGGLGRFDAICDALLGTGREGKIGEPYDSLVEAANRASGIKVAVDVPTGVEADSGYAPGKAFQADVTVTMGLPKVGLLLPPGAAFAGELAVADIGMPRALLEEAAGVDLLDSFDSVPRLPDRPLDAHKNRMGHLLLIAGSPGKAGAALLGGRAALRTGVGLCTVATHAGCRDNLEGRVPDLMVEKLDWDCRPEDDVIPLLDGKTALALGPGLGTCQEARDLVEQIICYGCMPLVVDADGLNVFRGEALGLSRCRVDTIITPHPGEMARLLGTDTGTVQSDRLKVASQVAAKLGVIVVLKGAGTVLANPDGRLAICMSGSPALAKAGSGDVLTGILGALLAMGMNAWDAARLGVFLHGRVGELSEARYGIHGSMASDLPDLIPGALAE